MFDKILIMILSILLGYIIRAWLQQAFYRKDAQDDLREDVNASLASQNERIANLEATFAAKKKRGKTPRIKSVKKKKAAKKRKPAALKKKDGTPASPSPAAQTSEPTKEQPARARRRAPEGEPAERAGE